MLLGLFGRLRKGRNVERVGFPLGVQLRFAVSLMEQGF